ncbi:MAG TPA: hypothetical protein VJ885_06635, partial [Thermoanaerobaculia bacterium]|nr:hypothetical protein [Thermoanaerobaculia bacterium]
MKSTQEIAEPPAGALGSKYPATRINPNCVEIPKSARADMLVPARVWVDEEMWEKAVSDRTLDQLVNVATLPGACG